MALGAGPNGAVRVGRFVSRRWGVVVGRRLRLRTLQRGEVRLEREVDARGAADARTGHVGDSEIAQELGDSDVRGLNRECDER